MEIQLAPTNSYNDFVKIVKIIESCTTYNEMVQTQAIMRRFTTKHGRGCFKGKQPLRFPKFDLFGNHVKRVTDKQARYNNGNTTT